MSKSILLGVPFLLPMTLSVASQTHTRARDLGIPFEGNPGPMNAITDVKGVTVGQTTLISGEGKLIVGKGPVRTGVTAILPQGREFRGRVFGAWYGLNGNGEMTGTAWLEESGCLGSPIMITDRKSTRLNSSHLGNSYAR